MAPAELSTEQWEVIVDLVKKESISILFVSFKEMIKNPDPRVKWAMDIMDQEGEVCSLIFTLAWIGGLFSGTENYVCLKSAFKI